MFIQNDKRYFLSCIQAPCARQVHDDEVRYHNVCGAWCVSLICFRVNCWQRTFDGLLALKLKQAAAC